MSGKVEFTARCFGAKFRIRRLEDGRWFMTLYTFAGKQKAYRGIAFVTGDMHQAPRVSKAELETSTAATVWIGVSSFELPDHLVPKLQAFLAEDSPGGAA